MPSFVLRLQRGPYDSDVRRFWDPEQGADLRVARPPAPGEG